MMDRRMFLSIVGLAGAGTFFDRRLIGVPRIGVGAGPTGGVTMSHARATVAHPTPRPGITGAKVLSAAELAKWPDLLKLFDGIRAIPAIADGLRCSCGCADLPGYYSLLSCYEGAAMATMCPICQGAGRLTVRLAGEGQTLAQIRVAVDAQFG